MKMPTVAKVNPDYIASLATVTEEARLIEQPDSEKLCSGTKSMLEVLEKLEAMPRPCYLVSCIAPDATKKLYWSALHICNLNLNSPVVKDRSERLEILYLSDRIKRVICNDIMFYLLMNPKLAKDDDLMGICEAATPHFGDASMHAEDLFSLIRIKDELLEAYRNKKDKAKIERLTKKLEKATEKIKDLYTDRDKAIFEKEELKRKQSGRQKITQELAARAYGVSVRTIKNWENGKRPPEYKSRAEELQQFFYDAEKYKRRRDFEKKSREALKNKSGSNRLNNR